MTVRGAGMFLIVTWSLAIVTFSAPDPPAGRNLGIFRAASDFAKRARAVSADLRRQASSVPKPESIAERSVGLLNQAVHKNPVSDVVKRVHDVSVEAAKAGVPDMNILPREVVDQARDGTSHAREVSSRVRERVTEQVNSFLAKHKGLPDTVRNRLNGLGPEVQRRFDGFSLSLEDVSADSVNSNQVDMGESFTGLEISDFVTAEVSSAAASANEDSDEQSSEEAGETSDGWQNLKENVLKTVQQHFDKLPVQTGNLHQLAKKPLDALATALPTETRKQVKDKASELMQQVEQNTGVAKKELERFMASPSPLVEKAKNEVMDTAKTLRKNTRVKAIREKANQWMHDNEHRLNEVAKEIGKNKIVSAIGKDEPGVLRAFGNMFLNKSSFSSLLVGAVAFFVASVMYSRLSNRRELLADYVELSTPVV